MTRDTMTSAEFTAARERLGLSINELAVILNTSRKTVIKWETRDGIGPHPTAVRVMLWMLAGWRPPEFPV